MKEVRTGTQFKLGRNLETGADNEAPPGDWLGTHDLINLLSYRIQFLYLRHGALPHKSWIKKMPNDLPTTQSYGCSFCFVFLRWDFSVALYPLLELALVDHAGIKFRETRLPLPTSRSF